jgi:hypothetical protein
MRGGFFLEYLLQQMQRKKAFAKHATNSRCQCDISSKNVVSLPHISGNFSREEIVVVEDESADIEAKTVHPPLSHNNFRIHQQLNHMGPMSPAAVPVPVFSMGQQSAFTFFFAHSLLSAQYRSQLLSSLERDVENGNSNVFVKRKGRNNWAIRNQASPCIQMLVN